MLIKRVIKFYNNESSDEYIFTSTIDKIYKNMV
jgi:hypothetical protein